MLKIIGQCDVIHTMTLLIKTMTLVLNVSAYITGLAVILILAMIFVSTFITAVVLYIELARYIFRKVQQSLHAYI